MSCPAITMPVPLMPNAQSCGALIFAMPHSMAVVAFRFFERSVASGST